MDSVARLDANERRLYFEQAAANQGQLSAQLIEKDFWVCWTLRRIFSLPQAEHLTFKGGTSLSKVYHVIERFSEDIDLTIDREHLGFGGDDDPEQAASNKETERRIERLTASYKDYVSSQIYPQLLQAISTSIGANSSFSVKVNNESDTINFEFPTSVSSGLSQYFAPSIKIEFGARADSYPVETATIKSYLHELFPGLIEDGDVSLSVLDAERTFWEKATILHSIYHRPANKPLGPRHSRHYYDLFKLACCEIGERAVKRLELLKRVAEHKRIYYRAGWAKYNEAKPGSLRLVPNERRIQELKSDYQAMQPMFFGDAPTFEKITSQLGLLEEGINSIA